MTLLELMQDANRGYEEHTSGKRSLSDYYHPETGQPLEKSLGKPDPLAALIVGELAATYHNGHTAQDNYRNVVMKFVEMAKLLLAVAEQMH